MARARNIKPGLFINDELAESNSPLGRLLFIGLWTIADYKGDLEWKPKKIKAQLLPYDDCNIEELAINLDKSGFIRFYSGHDKMLLSIVNFCKHQNPHKNEREKGSDVPGYTEEGRQVVDLTGLTINRDLSGLKPDDSASDPADSLNLIPDSLNLIPGQKDNGSSIEQPAAAKKVKRFEKPTTDQLIEHFNSMGSSEEEASNFWNYYESNGWKVGRNPMKSWKAATANWLKNSRNYN